MTRFAHYQKFTRWYEIGVVIAFLVVNAVVLATTRIFDAQRDGELSFEMWEPFVWEFSSVAMIIGLLPAVHWLYDSRFTDWRRIKRTLAVYFLASIIFSVVHVAGMVLIRELVYATQQMNYDFGDLGFEFFYEYRKDLLTFILIVALLAMHRALAKRLQGEATLMAQSEESDLAGDRILVTKLGKEFIVKIADIEWLESSGNYVNLYVGKRIYPTRNTLTKLMDVLKDKGFCRTHRSFGVNLDAIESISPNTSGASEIHLKDGQIVALSRRYREELKRRLGR